MEQYDVRDTRIDLVSRAQRADAVFDRTLLHDPRGGDGQMPPALRELNLMSHYGAHHGFALAAVINMIAEDFGDVAAEKACSIVADIAVHGDDSWNEDVWEAAKARLVAVAGAGAPAGFPS